MNAFKRCLQTMFSDNCTQFSCLIQAVTGVTHTDVINVLSESTVATTKVGCFVMKHTVRY